MEKLSLYDFLSVLLPGALLTLFIEVLASDLGLEIKGLKINQYFRLTLFLTSAIFLGSLINISTRFFFKFYRKINLFTSIIDIYTKSKSLKYIRYYFDDILIDTQIPQLNTDNSNANIENLWNEIYYELEATDKIKVPKSFQSFYFFFRNFFTLGMILFPVLTFLFIYNRCAINKYTLLFIINIIGLLISLYVGKWYRGRMVERMFWTYYSLHKNDKTNQTNQ